jgi:hypothetical protein
MITSSTPLRRTYRTEKQSVSLRHFHYEIMVSVPFKYSYNLASLASALQDDGDAGLPYACKVIVRDLVNLPGDDR